MSRYSVYELKGRCVLADVPKRFGGGVIDGEITNVFRDPLEHKLSLTVNGKEEVVFREPTRIEVHADSPAHLTEQDFTLCFVYEDEVDDEDVGIPLLDDESLEPVVTTVCFDVSSLPCEKL